MAARLSMCPCPIGCCSQLRTVRLDVRTPPVARSSTRLLQALPDGSTSAAYEAMELLLSAARRHVCTRWQPHADMWRADLPTEIESLGDEIEAWKERLLELRNGRAALVAHGAEALVAEWELGPLVIEGHQLQVRYCRLECVHARSGERLPAIAARAILSVPLASASLGVT